MIKKLLYIFFLFTLFEIAMADINEDFITLNINTAILVPSQAIDEYPHWSIDSKMVAVNIMGEWHSINLDEVNLKEILWQGVKIGININPNSLKKLTEDDFKKNYVNNPPSDMVFSKETNKSIKIEKKGFESKIIINKDVKFFSGFEVYHSLVLSPDMLYVLYIAELNGLVIIKLN
jgi:hypothetical protein